MRILFFLQLLRLPSTFTFFFFNDTATTEIYTLSLHDALPISTITRGRIRQHNQEDRYRHHDAGRSEEHTSELQSPDHLVCRLLLEKKKKKKKTTQPITRSRNSSHPSSQHPPTTHISSTNDQPS